MAKIALNPISSHQPKVSVPSEVQPKPRIDSVGKGSKNFTANGTKEVGDKAYKDAIRHLTELLSSKKVKVSSSYDAKTGMNQVKLIDEETGKMLMEMPPKAVVEIAEKARNKQIGWLIDRLR